MGKILNSKLPSVGQASWVAALPSVCESVCENEKQLKMLWVPVRYKRCHINVDYLPFVAHGNWGLVLSSWNIHWFIMEGQRLYGSSISAQNWCTASFLHNSFIFAFLDIAGDCVKWQQFSKVLHGSMAVSHVIWGPWTSAFTDISHWVPGSFHNIWYCRLFKILILCDYYIYYKYIRILYIIISIKLLFKTNTMDEENNPFFGLLSDK